MQILQNQWVDFVVRSENPYQFHVERIPQNDDVACGSQRFRLNWSCSISVLPELAIPRHNKYQGIPRTSNKMGIFESYNLYFMILNILYI